MPIYLKSTSGVQTTEIVKKTAPEHSTWYGIACFPIAYNAPPQIDEIICRNTRIIGADCIVRPPIDRAEQAHYPLVSCSRPIQFAPRRQLHISPSKKAIAHLSCFLAFLKLTDIQMYSRPVDIPANSFRCQIAIGADSPCARRFIVQNVPTCKGNQEKKGDQQKSGKQKGREGDKGSQRIKKQKGK